jgi:ADP-heptose:LPS heptosyltransferase
MRQCIQHAGEHEGGRLRAVACHHARNTAHIKPSTVHQPYNQAAACAKSQAGLALSAKSQRSAIRRVMRILFITSSRIGDAVLSTGLIDHLLKTHPDARFTIACGPVAEGVFARMPNRDRTIVLNKRGRGQHWLELWRATVGVSWDLVVDIRGSLISYLVPTKRRAVMRKSSGHKTVQLARLLKLDHAPMPVAWTAQEDRDLAAQLLPDGAPLIGLGPTANWSGKVWPPERFVEFAHRLTAEALPGARVVLFAGPGAQEAGQIAPVQAAMPEAIDLTGKLDLPQVAACLARCVIFIGNDSGLMHIAAATGIPTIGLFGPSPVAEYAPIGKRAAPVISTSDKMADISVDAALVAASTLM